MQFDQIFANSKAQAAPSMLLSLRQMGLIKLLEQFLLSYPRACVTHADHNSLCLASRSHYNATALGKTYCIGKNVQENLTKPHTVSKNSGEVTRELLLQIESFPLGQGAHDPQGLTNNLIKVRLIPNQG